MSQVEIIISQLVNGIFGANPIAYGIIMLMFFVGLAVALRLSIEGMVIILVPALLYMFVVIPIMTPLKYVFGVGAGILIGIAIIRLLGR